MQLAVEGNRTTIQSSSFYDGRCGAAVEVRLLGTNNMPDGLDISFNRFVANGNHRRGWSDGLTVHGARNSIFSNNTFNDNTDVQMIFGACLNCDIGNNDFRHSGNAEGGSFGSLLMYRWSGHSGYNVYAGNYNGTVVHDNSIKCSAGYNCGFGILVGGDPWESSPGVVTGVTVRNNVINNAQHALVVTKSTNNIELRDNTVNVSWTRNDRFPTLCGEMRLGTKYMVSPQATNIRAYPLISGEGALVKPKWDSPCVPNWIR